MHATLPRPVRRRTAAGLTLIELLIVIAMVGILSALVLPKVRIDNSQVDAAARTMGLSLMVAQREAAARQHNVLLVFDTAAHTITTVWDANSNGVIDAGEKTRPFILPDRVILGRPSSVSALGAASASVPTMATAGGKPMLIVQRNGSLDRSVTLYLTTNSSMAGSTTTDARAVILSRATARPEWYAWTGSAWRHAK
jgi:prepilin-type N-terminal cleavage/methylation domain-containing protein